MSQLEGHVLLYRNVAEIIHGGTARAGSAYARAGHRFLPQADDEKQLNRRGRSDRLQLAPQPLLTAGAKLLAVFELLNAKSLTSFLTLGALAWNMQHLGQETSSDLARVMAFSLQRYWKLKEAERLAPVARYEEELMWANWNPEVPSLLQSSCPTEQEPTVTRAKADT